MNLELIIDVSTLSGFVLGIAFLFFVRWLIKKSEYRL